MVEYGPFIEYCCDVYVHHTVVDVVVIVLAFMSLLVAALLCYLFKMVKCHFCSHKKRTSLFPGTSFSREADAALSASDCEDEQCLDTEE